MAALNIEIVRELMCNGAAFLEGGDAHVTAAADRIRFACGGAGRVGVGIQRGGNRMNAIERLIVNPGPVRMRSPWG